MTTNVLYLPIEIVERELDAKLLLALEALDRGYTVFIGQYQVLPDIAMKIGRGGFYLYKAMTDYRARKLFLPLRERGIASGALDEEGLIFPSLDYYARTRVGEGESLPVLTRVFTWGDVQANFLSERYGLDSSKLMSSGNPRFDLLRPPYSGIYAERASEIADQFGDFVLVNTNFGPGNYSPKFGMSYHEHMRFFGRVSTAEEEKYYAERTKYFGDLFLTYVDMVRALAKEIFPTKVIVRPHPVEDHERWRRLVLDTPNVQVVFSGSAIDWIVASKCLIHTGCTTGVEAFVLGKTIFRFNPNLRSDMESELPNRLGHDCTRLDELVGRVKTFLLCGVEETQADERQVEYLESWVRNLRGPYSYQRIMDTVDEWRLGEVKGEVSAVRFPIRYVRLLLRNSVIRKLAAFAKRWPILSKLRLSQRATERVQRFSGIRQKMIRDRLGHFYQLKHGEAIEKLNVALVGPDVFRIELGKTWVR